MIEELTDEQKAKFPEYVKKWTAIGLCTDPADRENAEIALAKVYRCGGFEPPQLIVWCESPASMAITIALMKDKKNMKAIGWQSVEERNGTVDKAILESEDDIPWCKEDSTKELVSCYKENKDKIPDRVKFIEDAKRTIYNSMYGCHDASFLSFYSYMRNELGLVEQTEKISGLMEFALYAGWAVPYKDICFISERNKVLKTDTRGMLHCEDGPAVSYPDGYSVYSVHGVKVPEYIIMRPEEITVQKIEEEQNAEIRRVMISKYTEARYLQDSGAQMVQKDEWGELYRKEIPGDEPLVMVRLVDKVKMPDGSEKAGFFRVPPDMETAHQAVAWGYGETPETYNPIIET